MEEEEEEAEEDEEEDCETKEVRGGTCLAMKTGAFGRRRFRGSRLVTEGIEEAVVVPSGVTSGTTSDVMIV